MVGVGIKIVGHVTLETQAFIEQAEKVLYMVANDPMVDWIRTLNPTAEALDHYYADDKLRLQTYHEMVERILGLVRQGLRVCVVFYGHPGIVVTPAHIAIDQARAEGFSAWMLPAISAEDCLLADLSIDPVLHGLQSFEATKFLLQKRQVDITSNLILWQVGTIGVLRYYEHINITNGLRALTEYLLNFYNADHEIILYEASLVSTVPPHIQHLPLVQLPAAAVTRMSTLYIPPQAKAAYDPIMMERLGITSSDLSWN